MMPDTKVWATSVFGPRHFWGALGGSGTPGNMPKSHHNDINYPLWLDRWMPLELLVIVMKEKC